MREYRYDGEPVFENGAYRIRFTPWTRLIDLDQVAVVSPYYENAVTVCLAGNPECYMLEASYGDFKRELLG